MRAAKQSTGPISPLTYRNAKVQGYPRGVGLAIEMLTHLERNQQFNDVYNLEPEYRPRGTQQQNILLEYLDAVRAEGREAEVGFAAALTDFVANCRGGIVPDTKNYLPFTSETSHG